MFLRDRLCVCRRSVAALLDPIDAGRVLLPAELIDPSNPQRSKFDVQSNYGNT